MRRKRHERGESLRARDWLRAPCLLRVLVVNKKNAPLAGIVEMFEPQE
jgi:hypothetical protein